jgi:hypothetical protein
MVASFFVSVRVEVAATAHSLNRLSFNFSKFGIYVATLITALRDLYGCEPKN